MEQARPDSTLLSAAQMDAEHHHDGTHQRDARITRVLTAPDAIPAHVHPICREAERVNTAAAAEALAIATSPALRAAIVAHRDAYTALQFEPDDSDPTTDRHCEAVTAATHAIIATPSVCLADHRAKLGYLLPGILGDVNGVEPRAHLIGLLEDVARLASKAPADPGRRAPPVVPAAGSEEAKAAFRAACTETDRLMLAARDGYPELRRNDGWTWDKLSLGKALDDGTVSPTEYARLHWLATEREHRMEAAVLATNLGSLFALAHADEYPKPTTDDGGDLREPAAPVLAATAAPDPFLAVAEAARAANVALDEFGRRMLKFRPEGWLQEEWELVAEQERTQGIALATVPTTQAGRIALADYMAELMGRYGMADGGPPEDGSSFWAFAYHALSAALRAPIPPAAAGRPDIAPQHDLSALTLNDLAHLHMMASNVWNITSMFVNAPFSWDGRREYQSQLGDIIEVEVDRWADLATAVAEEAARRKPQDKGQRDRRLEIAAQHAMLGGGKIDDRALVAELAAAWGA